MKNQDAVSVYYIHDKNFRSFNINTPIEQSEFKIKMCMKLIITFCYCIISSSLKVVICDQEVKYKFSYSYSYSSNQEALIFKNDSLDDSYRNSTECFRLSLEHCDIKNGSNCLDDLYRIIQYNDSGCINGILSCNCATYDKNVKTLEIGRCVYNCKHRDNYMLDDTKSYTKVHPEVFQWNDLFCGPFNRSGSLCGKCQEGLYANAYSFDLSCGECSNVLLNLWKYIVIAFIPLTCFCFLILSFNLVVPTSLLQGFAIFCQLISAPIYLRVALLSVRNFSYTYKALQLVASLYGIWNLDFLRTYDLDICLQTDTLTTISLDLAVALYPLILIMLTFILMQMYEANFTLLVFIWKPFRLLLKYFNKQWNIKVSIANSFATFMLLSSVKLLNVCFDILIPVEVVNFSSPGNGSTRSWRVYYDANILYFRTQHLPYAIIAIIVLFTNILIPTFVLLLYPFSIFQIYLNRFPHRLQLVLRTFVDSFQGCYKDGLQSNSLDYRCLSAMPFIFRLFFFILYALILDVTFNVLATIGNVLLCILFLYLDPFKDQNCNVNSIISFLFLGLFCVCSVLLSSNYNITSDNKLFLLLAFTIGTLPLLYLLLCAFIRLYLKINAWLKTSK